MYLSSFYIQFTENTFKPPLKKKKKHLLNISHLAYTNIH